MNKKRLRKIRTNLIKFKIIMSRMGSYFNILNNGMLIFLVLSNLKEFGYINFDLGKYFFLIWFIGMLFGFTWGFLEVNVAKGFQTEVNRNHDLDPRWLQLERNIELIKQNTGVKNA